MDARASLEAGRRPRWGLAFAALTVGLAGLVSACDRGDPPAQANAAPPAPAAANAPAAAGPESEPSTEPSQVTPIQVTPIQVTPPASTGVRPAGGSSPEAEVIPSPAPGESLAECLDRCAAADLSQDNRATCRLLCESHHGPKTSKSNDALLGRFFACFDQCDGHDCEAGCAREAGSTACSRSCLSSLANCLPACASAATPGHCSERCETSARRCLADCA